jgi:ATP-dependent RNA helicase DDX19/DBP5
MGKFVPLKTYLAVKEGWNKSTRVDAQVVVGTPGTVMDMIAKRVLDVSAIRTFVLDEADEMVGQQGIGEQTMRIKK